MRNLILVFACLLVGCSASQQSQIQSTLQNVNTDAQIVAPVVNKLVCLDAAGAAISGPLLSATGNDAGQVVGAAGSAIAQKVCPPGTTPAPAAQ